MRKMEGLQWSSLEPSDDKAKSSVKQIQQDQPAGGMMCCQTFLVFLSVTG